MYPIRGVRYFCQETDINFCSICEDKISYPYALMKIKNPKDYPKRFPELVPEI